MIELLIEMFAPSYIHGNMAHKFLPNNRKLLDYEGKSICSATTRGCSPYFVMIILMPGQMAFS